MSLNMFLKKEPKGFVFIVKRIGKIQSKPVTNLTLDFLKKSFPSIQSSDPIYLLNKLLCQLCKIKRTNLKLTEKDVKKFDDSEIEKFARLLIKHNSYLRRTAGKTITKKHGEW